MSFASLKYKIWQWIKVNQTEVLIFSLAFGVRFIYGLAVLIFFGEHGFVSHSDAFSFYVRGAENLINQHIFSLNTNAPFMPDAYRTPLYTSLVALFLWLGLPLYCLIFTQNILAGAVAVLVYRISNILFNNHRIGLWAAILTSLEPLSWHWNNLIMSDFLFMFFFVWAMYKFFLKDYYWFAFLMGLATLTRPLSLYFFPLFILAAAIDYCMAARCPADSRRQYFGHQAAGTLIKKFIIATLIFLAIIFPWMLRNKITFDTWQLTSAFWYNLYALVGRIFAEQNSIVAPMPTVPAGYPNPQNFIYDFVNVPFYQQHFFEIFFVNPLSYLKFHFMLSFQSLFVNYYDNFIQYVLMAKFPSLALGFIGQAIYSLSNVLLGLWVIIYTLFALAFFDKRARLWWLVFASILFFIMLTHGVSGLYGLDGSRFFMPVAPFIFMFAAKAITNIVNRSCK